MGFTRRYNFQPTRQQITMVEGVIIVDNPAPGDISGAGTGVAACIGEFSDVTFATKTDGNGGILTSIQPTQVFGHQDAVNKFGPFDPTLGDFAISGGNGYVDALVGKQWTALVLVAINNASSKGARLVRSLPTNQSPTSPVPAVAMQAAGVQASFEFKDGAGHRVRVAGSQTFTGDAAYSSGTDASLTGAATALAQSLSSAGITAAIALGLVKIGDILVLGVVGDATYGVATIMNGFHGTYRVKTIPAAGPITIEQLDGSTFAIPTQATIPWRLHAASTADSMAAGQNTNPGGLIAAAAGFTVPVRPLDATIAAGASCLPTTPVAAPTATSWDPLSDLTLLALAASGALTFTAAVQAPNAAASGTFDAAYIAALASLLSDTMPANTVNIVWAARTSAAIRSQGKLHADTVSARGIGRVFISSPELSVFSPNTVGGNADPGVGANRDERVFYTWPGARMQVAEAINVPIQTALNTPTSDGVLDVRMDSLLASICSVLAPERNPGQTSPPAAGDGGVLSVVLGFQRGIDPNLMTIDAYTFLRAQGVAALHFDQTLGPEIMSGVTTSLLPGQTDINRRRFQDFIDSSVSSILMPFAKLPASTVMRDSALGEVDNFLADLLSSENPAAQRIQDYDCALTSTPDMLKAGIFQVSVEVLMIPIANFIVVQSSVGATISLNFKVGGGTVS